MKKLRAQSNSARGMRRYSIVRAISRGGDLLISSVIEAFCGGSWFWYITALCTGGAFNVVIDYTGQKYWVNESKTRQSGINVKETGRYTFVRLYYLPIGVASHATLYQYVGIPFILSSILTSLGLWIISYRNTRGIYNPYSTRWIPWPFRSYVVKKRKEARQQRVRLV